MSFVFFLSPSVQVYACTFFAVYVWPHIARVRINASETDNPALGQLNRENEYFPIPVHDCEIGLARRFRQSRPASACSFHIQAESDAYLREIPPDFCDGVHLSI